MLEDLSCGLLAMPQLEATEMLNICKGLAQNPFDKIEFQHVSTIPNGADILPISRNISPADVDAHIEGIHRW